MQTSRSVRASSSGICVAPGSSDASTAAAAAASSSANEKMYLAVMVAFISAFGTSILAFFAGVFYQEAKAPRYGGYANAIPGKIPDMDTSAQEVYLEQRAASGRLAAQNSLKTYA